MVDHLDKRPFMVVDRATTEPSTDWESHKYNSKIDNCTSVRSSISLKEPHLCFPPYKISAVGLTFVKALHVFVWPRVMSLGTSV